MVAPEPSAVDGVELVVAPDAAHAGASVRAHLHGGRRAAGFVGDPDDPALAEFVADVLRPGQPTVNPVDMPSA